MHGWGGGYINFESSALALSDRYTCVNLSFFDAVEACPLCLDDYADYLQNIVAKLRKIGVKQIIAVGHSFGGRVCIRLASRAIVDKIMLIDSAGLRPKRRIRHIISKLRYKIRKALALDTTQCGSADYRILSPVRKRTFNNIVREYQDEECKNITTECMIFWGEKDKDTPLYMAKRLNKYIKNSGLYIAIGGGHYSYLDAYGAFLHGLEIFASS